MHERDMGGKSIFKLNPRTGVSCGSMATTCPSFAEIVTCACRRKAYEEQQLWSHPLLEAVRVLEGLEAGQRTLLKAKLKIRS